jgi:hypothetical protein
LLGEKRESGELLASGGVAASDTPAAGELDVQATLKKPFETQLLLRTLRHVLSNQTAPAASKSGSAEV